MARSRSARRSKGGRDPGGFVALPWLVLDSAAYRNCSAPARALLLELARQFHGDDNGRLLLTRAYLGTRGWRSADVIHRAKRELLENRLIHETVPGQRPHKASWFALTWLALDKLDGLDPDRVITFSRGAYRDVKAAKTASQPFSACPSHGTEKARIAPSHGTGKAPAIPPRGAIEAGNEPASIPPHGTPLEMPSPRVHSSASESLNDVAGLLDDLKRRNTARGLS